MKNIFFTLCAVLLLSNFAKAQYCGNSGYAICDTVALDSSGFSPVSDSLVPFTNGTDTTVIINFKNYNTVPGLGTMTSLRIDSITNLPSGVCWAANAANNTYGNQQNGCIKLTGTACAPPGQYLVHIHVLVNNFFPTDLVNQGLKYYIRVQNAGDTIIPVDTTGTVNYIASPYGSATTNCSASAVTDLNPAMNSLSLYPIPMTSTMQVKFNSIKTGQVTERITNIIGAEVHSSIRNVHTGTNSFTVDRNSLPAGVYFYSLTEGQTVITKRIIISD